MVTKPPTMGEALFPGKYETEEFQFAFHKHWIRLLWPFLKLLLWTAIIVVIGWMVVSVADSSTRHLIFIVLLTAFYLTQLEFLCHVYRYFLYVVVVTDKKVHRITKALLTVDDHQSIDLWVLQDIDKRQHGIVQNILGFGTIILDAQETQVRLHFTPRIEEKYRKLMSLREQARNTAYAGAFQKRQQNMSGDNPPPSLQ